MTASLRLLRLHAASRRVPVALILLALLGTGLRLALIAPWDAYGAFQLPLIFEAGCAAVISVTAGSLLGEPERVASARLPLLRLSTIVTLTAVAAVVLTAAGIGTTLSGGATGVLRNLLGLTGIGLLCAVMLGGGLAWTGPLGYLIAGLYAIYTQWHRPALTTPWLWPARPADDLGGAVCAVAVFAAGILFCSVRGAHDRGEQ